MSIFTGLSGGIAFLAVMAVTKCRRATLIDSPSSNNGAIVRFKDCKPDEKVVRRGLNADWRSRVFPL
jgi:hypothetical protein